MSEPVDTILSESAESVPPERPVFDVPAIFLDPDADLLLQSSDGVLFKVFKSFLIFGSHFFRDMFKHSHPAPDPSNDPVLWDEPAELITTLLYQLYPIPKPKFTDMEELARVMKGADKWGMDRVLDYCRVELQQPRFLDHHPIAIFKLAASFEMTDVKDKVSRRLVELHDPMEEALRQDLVGVTAGDLASWYDMRKRRMTAVTNAVQRHLACINGANTPTKRFRERANKLLSENLAASAIDQWPIIDTTYTDYCNSPCCSGRKLSSRLKALQDELENPDVFFGTSEDSA